MKPARPPIPIETGVPIPEHTGPGRRNPDTEDIYDAAANLDPGQSFLIDVERFHRGMPTNFSKTFGGKYTLRVYKTGPDAGKVRIWRRK